MEKCLTMRITTTLLVAIFIVTNFSKIGTAKASDALNNMVQIPAGEFVMGNTFNRFNPFVRTVYVGEFYVDKYEVTKALWDEVYQWATSHEYKFDNRGVGKDLNHPVYGMNWYDMVKWCNARSEKEGYVPSYYTDTSLSIPYRTGNIDTKNNWVKWDAGYRLPTEAEWEKAARGGLNGKRFPWGDTISHSQANYFSSATLFYDISPTRGLHPKFKSGIYPYTNPVGYFAPNGYGLYDVTGNVWEWCWDWYVEINFDSSPANNPRGPTTGKGRTLRGGSLGGDAWGNGVGFRNGDGPYTMTYSEVGFRTVLSAKTTTSITPIPDPVQIIKAQPVQPTYSKPPEKEGGKDSLVIVTHGWKPDITWVETMTNVITDYLTANRLSNWQVSAYKWAEKAQTPLPLGPEITLSKAEQEGASLGDFIATKEWKHVHLIAHSAGAPLIEKVAEKIKDKWASNTAVHLTFLDPYVGLVYGGRNKYGVHADWADNYFSRDLGTSGETFTLTEGALKYAFNVDVTFLDKSKTKGDVYRSSSGSIVQQCQEAITTHDWPYEFYTQTIPPSVLLGAENFGFSLSKVGGGWNPVSIQHKAGNDPSFILGNSDPSCLPSLYETTPAYVGDQMNFSTIPTISSPTGIIQKNDFGVNLISIMQGVKLQSLTHSKLSTPVSSVGPAWLASTITVTNAVNFLSFDSRFLSDTGAEGLLSVYWDTNVVGTIDERTASSGIRQYTFPIPKVTNGIGTLGFRLDSFTNTTSSVTVTNVSLGFVGMREQFSLSFAGSGPDGLPTLQLTGQKDFNYTVETSTNFVDWKVFAILVNTNGVVRFNTAPNNTTAHFYRAVVP